MKRESAHKTDRESATLTHVTFVIVVVTLERRQKVGKPFENVTLMASLLPGKGDDIDQSII